MSTTIPWQLLLPLLLLSELAAAEDAGDFLAKCPITHSKTEGPEIGYPFVQAHQPSRGVPGFELSCTAEGSTIIHRPYKGDFSVKSIYCCIQCVELADPINVSSSSPFRVDKDGMHNFSLFNCGSINASTMEGMGYPDDPRTFFHIDFYSKPGSHIYAARSHSTLAIVPPSCERLEMTITLNGYFMQRNAAGLVLKWELPNCGFCEADGQMCDLNFCANPPPANDTGGLTTAAIIGIVVTIMFSAVLAVAFYYWDHKFGGYLELNPSEVESFLDSYQSLNPKQYSYSDVKRMTNNFREKLGQGGFGSVFRGRLLNGLPVAIKTIETTKTNGDEFVNEVTTIGKVHHVNVVRLLGFCAERFKRALIYEFMPNGSLEKFIFSSKSKPCDLGWDKLHEIAVGIARGIEYLHQGCHQRILHFDIKPHNILLDHKFTPKISDFGLAKSCSRDQNIVSMTAARGTAGYIAPEVVSRNFGNVSYKSDVYSFGMLLLEMVGKRKNIDVNVEHTSQVYFPEWIYNRVTLQRELGDGVVVAEEEDEVAKKLVIVALWCIQMYPVDRPNMKKVVQMLEGASNMLELPPNPFVSNTTKPHFREMQARAYNRNQLSIS